MAFWFGSDWRCFGCNADLEGNTTAAELGLYLAGSDQREAQVKTTVLAGYYGYSKMVPHNYHMIYPVLRRNRFAIKNGKVTITPIEDDAA